MKRALPLYALLLGCSSGGGFGSDFTVARDLPFTVAGDRTGLPPNDAAPSTSDADTSMPSDAQATNNDASTQPGDASVTLGADLSVPPNDLSRVPGSDGAPAGPDLLAVDVGAPVACSDRAKLIYVVDQSNVLLSFRPTTLQLTTIGTLHCAAQVTASPFSMAVDHDGTAWVLYSSGELFRVDTSNASCQGTGFVAGQHGYTGFGMAFSGNMPGVLQETLFVAKSDMTMLGRLGRIDTATLGLTDVAALNGLPELSGDGNAHLWGFFPDAVKPRVSQIDKLTGAENGTFQLPSLAGTPVAWAFAFWGGDFWIFLKRSTDASTSIYRLSSVMGTVTVPVPNTGRTVVGAGVSICAPVG